MTKNCQRCNSNRIVTIYTHGKDMNNVRADYLDYEKDGYLPDIPNITSGSDDTDYNLLEFRHFYVFHIFLLIYIHSHKHHLHCQNILLF